MTSITTSSPANPWLKYQVRVSPIDLPTAKIETFTVNDDQVRFFNLREHFNGFPSRLRPGTYTRLYVNSELVMSDTPDEIQAHLEPIRRATGTCLVNGLGLGVVIQGMLEKPAVERVYVVEKNPDVATYVGYHYLKKYGMDRLQIIIADALTYRPPKGQHYQVVWHDIWPDICTDNLPQYTTLLRRYGRRCDWQGAWQHGFLKRHKRREQRYV
jgi:hypothetical protein